MGVNRTEPYSILLVGQKLALLRALHFRLEMAEYRVRMESCHRRVLDARYAEAFDLIISDEGLLQESSGPTCAWWQEGGSVPPFIFLTSDDLGYSYAGEGGEWVVKPFDTETLFQTIQASLECHQ